MRITVGLYYNGARYLAAWLGRWTSADPIGIGADGPGLYNYTRGSPVNYTDPSGAQQVPAPPGYSKDRDVTIEHAPNAQGEIVVESQHFVDVDKARANPALNVAPASSGAVLDDPDYIEHLRGIGVIELGDAKAFAQGGWNDTAGWLGARKFDIDPEHEGGAIMGGHFGQNLALEGAGGLVARGIGRGAAWLKNLGGLTDDVAQGVKEGFAADKALSGWSSGGSQVIEATKKVEVAVDAAAGTRQAKKVVEASAGAEPLAQFDPARAGHVFRAAEGHVNPVSAGSQARFVRLFEQVASNAANLRPDAVRAGIISQHAADAGVRAFTSTGKSGQIWVVVRNGKIQNAGVNTVGAFR